MLVYKTLDALKLDQARPKILQVQLSIFGSNYLNFSIYCDAYKAFSSHA